LLALISTGKEYRFPESTPNLIKQGLKMSVMAQEGGPSQSADFVTYDKLTDAYRSGISLQLEQVLNQDFLKLQQDENLGLAKKLLKRLN